MSSPFLFINYLLSFYCVWSAAQTSIFSNASRDRYQSVETVILKNGSNNGLASRLYQIQNNEQNRNTSFNSRSRGSNFSNNLHKTAENTVIIDHYYY